MTSTRSLLYWFFLPFLCLCFASACKADKQNHSDGQSTAASEDFAGEPKFTADVHFLAGQVHESKIATPTPNARPLAASEIARYQAAALAQYSAALKLDPDHTPSLYRSAILLGNMKRHDASIAAWRRYADVVGRTPDSLVNLGIACEVADRAAEAEAAYLEATRRDPRHKAAHVNLGILLARQGKVEPAHAVLSQVLEPAAVHWHLGAGLAAGGHDREADYQFAAAARLDPSYSTRPSVEAARTARIE